MKKAIAIIQARMSSKRFPGKVMKQLAGKPLIWHIHRFLEKCVNIDKIIVATSEDITDDILCNYCNENEIEYFRGSLNNVYQRFLRYTKNLNQNSIIIRATADNPLPDGYFVDYLLKEYYSRKVDYLSSVHEFNNLPYGLSLEIFSLNKLKRYYNSKKLGNNKEHFTQLFKNTVSNKNYILKDNIFKKDYSLHNYSIDNYSEYLELKEIFEQLKDPINDDYLKIINQNATNFRTKLSQEYSKYLVVGTAQFVNNYGILKNGYSTCSIINP